MANTKKYVSFDKLSLYDEKIKKVISDGDAAALKSAKEYAEGLGVNYDAAGSAVTEAGKVQAKLDTEVERAKAREDEIAGLVATAQGEVDALELVVAEKADKTALDTLAGKVGEVPEGSTVMGIIKNIQDNAYDDTELKAEIDGKLALKADKTQVATDIADAVKVEEDARKAAIEGVQGAVDTLSGTHATDKAELEGKINLKADQSALDEVSGVANAAATKVALEAEIERAEGEEARIEGLITAEVERATEVEADFKSRIEAMEVFWDTTEDKDGVVNKLKEIQDYIASDETGAAEMLGSINKNKEDIAAMDEAYKAADDTLQGNIDTLSGVVDTKAAQSDLEELEGRMDDAEGAIEAVEGRLDVVEPKVETLEGKMEAVEGAVATKAEAQALADAVATLEGVDAGLAERIGVIEGQLGESGDVATDIATAKQEAIDAAAADATTKANKALEDAKKYADEEDAKIESRVDALESASATHALNSDLTALAGRVTTAEGEIDTLQSEMDAVEELAANNKAAHEANAAAIAKKADETALTAVSDRVTALETWHNNFTEVSEEEINSLFA